MSSLSNSTNSFVRFLRAIWLLPACCIGLAEVEGPLPAPAQARMEPAAPVSVVHQSEISSQNSLLNRQVCQAAQVGSLRRLKTLLAHGASANAAQENGWTALMLAAQNGYGAVVRYLLAHGADVHRRSVLYNDVDALMLAAEAGSIPICRMLLAHGVDVNETDVSGNTPLMLALGNGNLTPGQEYEVTKLLLERGAKVNARNSLKQTALDYADRPHSETQRTKVVNLLISAGGKK